MSDSNRLPSLLRPRKRGATPFELGLIVPKRCISHVYPAVHTESVVPLLSWIDRSERPARHRLIACVGRARADGMGLIHPGPGLGSMLAGGCRPSQAAPRAAISGRKRMGDGPITGWFGRRPRRALAASRASRIVCPHGRRDEISAINRRSDQETTGIALSSPELGLHSDRMRAWRRRPEQGGKHANSLLCLTRG